MTTRTELIARLRDSPWHLLRTEYSEAADMLEADEKLRGLAKLAMEYVDNVPDDRDNAVHIDRCALIATLKEVLK